ncbi:hypothetical protein [Paenibacillus lycopersici]|uniref:hypothetical protein n=1 Tax=Paenibacillus lycopersici TaxID=2704462 RepID=UPI0017812F3F|nr:hypothetical protein [Paenibacillus lycopersici]
MEEQAKFPFEEDILNLANGEEYVVFLRGRAFIIKPATNDDIERVGHGYYCMD